LIERAFIHVGGPPGSGKTALIEAVLARCDLVVLAARCRRDDSLAEPRESYPKAASEFRRYRQAGAIGRALFEFPKAADIDAFFMTGLMSGYSHAVILEGDMPFDLQDLDVFVAPPPEEGEELFVRTTRDVVAGHRDWIDALESVLREPDGMARWTEELVGAPGGSIASRVPDADAEWIRNRMLARLEAARQAPPPEPIEVWAITERYRGIEHARVAVVNISDESEREPAERLVSELMRLRQDEALLKDILSRRRDRRPVTAVVANLADPKDPGRKKAVDRIRRSMRPRYQ
jgi:hypothetical protein